MSNLSNDDMAALNALQKFLLALSNLSCSCGCLAFSLPLFLILAVVFFGFLGAFL